MDATSQQKVCKKGFTIIRPRENYPLQGSDKKTTYSIYYKSSTRREWTKLEGNFPSRAARDRRIKDLLKHPMIVRD